MAPVLIDYRQVSFVFSDALLICAFRSKGTPLIGKVEQKSHTAMQMDSNTHMETFGDKNDTYYLEFSFHMKHLGYYSPTMNSYMVSLKYDFEEFSSKHWLHTDTFADVSVDIRVISGLDSKLNTLMIKLMRVVKWILNESQNTKSNYPNAKLMANDLLTPSSACLYLNNMYYNNTLNNTLCIHYFKESDYIAHLVILHFALVDGPP